VTADRPLVLLVGEQCDTEGAHGRIAQALPALGIAHEWRSTRDIAGPADLAGADGIWVVPGSPYASMAGALTAIRHARETGLPYLGTCGGFQHALIEWARTNLGLPEAQDVQSEPDAKLALITPLSCSLRGEFRPLRMAAGSRLAEIYGQVDSVELYHCCYGLNEDFAGLFDGQRLAITAWDEEGAPRAVELADHPFFIGTLYQPELVSDGAGQHVLIRAFADAVRGRAGATEFAH
jgi:CTP synthase (UTP-ammonia lyase)